MNKKSFTLIELLLYIGISSIILSAAFVFMSLMLELKTKSITILETNSEGVNIIYTINRLIRNADKISGLSAQDYDNNLSFDSGGHNYEILLKNNILYISVDGNNYIPMHSDDVKVVKISFLNASLSNTPGIITTWVDLKYRNPENRNERYYEKIFYGSASLRR